ncbi:MAG: ribosome-binding factor A [Henriciella sp.]|jgi:ribosome-binding factor A|uniref:30S ribosome-binding factor RbfA n=1 Tax=Henriciella sp. TaxID=1968823 RepID=UPI000C0CC479|nr:30S ribosome-binding factor RbfA [Henriciella sp.]MAN74863.1 ribosome-binding factor A [Henriciella sp.]MBF33941.1 ribosome-binding factor A [Hyphomonadaceae bacterium]PHR80148.1 MAG: ribosome-binding factor A [Henriciella sp.]|tara:strand:- start:113 stop:547 length:435 start_codon:yes stop_codon:yes gene_type:complete
MAKKKKPQGAAANEPSQRQLRAGELIRHALTDIMMREEFRDPELQGINVTIGEVRTSPDLKHAHVFCSPLGETDEDAQTALAKALNRAAPYIRGRLGKQIDMKFTPQLHFIADHSYDEGAYMEAVFSRPEVRRDLEAGEDDETL